MCWQFLTSCYTNAITVEKCNDVDKRPVKVDCPTRTCVAPTIGPTMMREPTMTAAALDFSRPGSTRIFSATSTVFPGLMRLKGS
jgi:hypothetical protein